MNVHFNVPAVRYAAFLGLASLALACGKQKGKDAPAATPVIGTAAPVAPTGNVGPAPQQGDASSVAANGGGTPAATNTTPVVTPETIPGQTTPVVVVGGQTTVVDGGAPVGGDKAPITQSLQIGSFYQFNVPADMHVTEYLTNKTYNGGLVFYRVSPESDPTYTGNYSCDFRFDKIIKAGNAVGDKYDYCFSTPRAHDKEWMTNVHVANNHLQVATNAKAVNPNNQMYIDINVYDADYEYRYGRSRFEQLCLNSQGDIKKTIPINLIVNFWGELVQSQFVTCNTNIVLPQGPGLPIRDDNWSSNVVSVGSFMITSATAQLPDHNCFKKRCPIEFVNPAMLEVTIVSKTAYNGIEYFARDSQQLFINHLQRITP